MKRAVQEVGLVVEELYRGARCVLGKEPGYQGKETIKIDSGV